MFHQNIGTPVRSSAKYFVVVGLILLLVGIGYSVYLYKKAISPPVSGGMTTKQQQTVTQGCTSVSPCSPVMRTDGSTEIVHIKEGDSVCFEPYFWKNINKLGIKVSYKGGPETGYGSTGDSFRFIPETGLTPPRYWFVPEGSSKC